MNRIDPVEELGNDATHKVDSILLSMLFINLKRTDTCSIIYYHVLKVSNLIPTLRLQIQEFHINLHMEPGYLLLMVKHRN